MDELTDSRVIIHVDMDAFYAQVEQKRLGLDASVPLAVQQWNGACACVLVCVLARLRVRVDQWTCM